MEVKKKNKFNLSFYFVVGPENTKGRDVVEMIEEVVKAGFTFIQIRSKEASAKELIEITLKVSEVLKKLDKQDQVSLVVNDRLDIVLAAREKGAKVDGIHVGQTDIPVSTCRKYLGEDSIIGLSARTDELIDYVKTIDVSEIDYFGAGPLHESQTKPDCGLNRQGQVIIRTLDELKKLAEISPIPVVVGGGIEVSDLKDLAKTGVDGFFVVSAIASAEEPGFSARELVQAWKESVGKIE